MVKTPRFLLGLLFLLTVGCSSGESESTAEESGRGHVWEGQMRALDRARAVEQAMRDSAEEQRRKIEQQSR